jgi:general L-amino acid transport system substrate-binding protein
VGHNLGLEGDFAYYVIKYVGNYGEIFEKHFCKEETAEDCSTIRGPNKAWNKGAGGVLSSPPF